jgi:hypothetical protein
MLGSSRRGVAIARFAWEDRLHAKFSSNGRADLERGKTRVNIAALPLSGPVAFSLAYQQFCRVNNAACNRRGDSIVMIDDFQAVTQLVAKAR